MKGLTSEIRYVIKSDYHTGSGRMDVSSVATDETVLHLVGLEVHDDCSYVSYVSRTDYEIVHDEALSDYRRNQVVKVITRVLVGREIVAVFYYPFTLYTNGAFRYGHTGVVAKNGNWTGTIEPDERDKYLYWPSGITEGYETLGEAVSELDPTGYQTSR